MAEDKKHRIREPRLCRVCMCSLMTHAESVIGVHISCVFEASNNRVTIPRPIYGKKQRQV